MPPRANFSPPSSSPLPSLPNTEACKLRWSEQKMRAEQTSYLSLETVIYFRVRSLFIPLIQRAFWVTFFRMSNLFFIKENACLRGRNFPLLFIIKNDCLGNENSQQTGRPSATAASLLQPVKVRFFLTPADELRAGNNESEIKEAISMGGGSGSGSSDSIWCAAHYS